MIRLLVASFLLICSVALLAKTQARAQSPNPVLLAPAGGRAGLAPPAPPIPRMQSSAGSTGQALDGSISVHVPHSHRTVHIPAGTPFNTFQDRVAACTQYGAASGLRSGKLGAFTRSCAN
jgi:hypothetical protein